MEVGPAFQQPDATVPAENAVVIAGRPNSLRLPKASQGCFNQGQKNVRSVADEQLGLGAALVEQAGVVMTLVGIPKHLKTGLRFGVAIGGGPDELVGDGKTEQAASELMLGFTGGDVPADGFGLFGLVEIA